MEHIIYWIKSDFYSIKHTWGSVVLPPLVFPMEFLFNDFISIWIRPLHWENYRPNYLLVFFKQTVLVWSFSSHLDRFSKQTLPPVHPSGNKNQEIRRAWSCRLIKVPIIMTTTGVKLLYIHICHNLMQLFVMSSYIAVSSLRRESTGRIATFLKIHHYNKLYMLQTQKLSICI